MLLLSPWEPEGTPVSCEWGLARRLYLSEGAAVSKKPTVYGRHMGAREGMHLAAKPSWDLLYRVASVQGGLFTTAQTADAHLGRRCHQRLPRRGSEGPRSSV